MGRWELAWGRRLRRESKCPSLHLAWARRGRLAHGMKNRLREGGTQLVGTIYHIKPENVGPCPVSPVSNMEPLASKDSSSRNHHGGFQVRVYADQGEQRADGIKGRLGHALPLPPASFRGGVPSLSVVHVRISCKVTFKKRFLNENK